MTYLGHILTENGLKPDPEKVNAILKMPKPDNVESVRRLLGMANYLSRYFSKLADTCEPVRELTRPEKCVGVVSQTRTDAKRNQVITTTPVLRRTTYLVCSRPTEPQRQQRPWPPIFLKIDFSQ